MLVDKELLLSNEQSLTATAVSTYSVNLGAVRDVGKGKQLFVVVVIDTAVAVADAAKTLAISLITDDAEGLGSATTILTLPTIAGSLLTAGRTPIVIAIPPGIAEQYLGLTYTLSTTFTAFKVTAFVAFEYQSNL